jgi:hypothetical protein
MRFDAWNESEVSSETGKGKVLFFLATLLIVTVSILGVTVLLIAITA